MAKDYFQDIVPPSSDHARRTVRTEHEEKKVPAQSAVTEEERDEEFDQGVITEPAERSIRNIQVTPRAPRRTFPDRDAREVPPVGMGMPRRQKKVRWWIWGTAAASVGVLGLLLFVALRPTTVKVTPRSQSVSFDTTSQFAAYPITSGATDSLTYSVQESDLTDSEVVPSQGTVDAQEKSSGNITIYNDYQTIPLRLIATTRFETPEGLVFRVPADVVVPAKVGSTPGQVVVTVQADQAGANYNVAATKFTLPGLKSNSTMYAKVYAQSTESMSGGFVGQKPGVAAGARDAAIASMRTRLETKARAAAASTKDFLVFTELIQITYRELADTPEANGNIRLSQGAHVSVPMFPQTAFAIAVSQAFNIDAAGSTLTLVPNPGLSAQNLATTTMIGSDPIQFTLAGSGVMVWSVDAGALQRALAGKEKTAFNAIVAGIPSIQEAAARVQPFWKKTFPTTASEIKVDILKPLAK